MRSALPTPVKQPRLNGVPGTSLYAHRNQSSIFYRVSRSKEQILRLIMERAAALLFCQITCCIRFSPAYPGWTAYKSCLWTAPAHAAGA
ncbi:hypothetical protein WJX72_007595 [[Myrmecia] bisecta]|uniref:Uncharacterized protein n=1 Tax=[Myrmecia] bisecta TaxID=41462 RepID=A0AAW1R858_9CHLO